MKRFARIRGEVGLSLTELLVVSAIMVTLSALVYASFRYESQVYRRELSRGATVADLRVWTAMMVKDVRNAGYDPRGTAGAAISSATPSDFQFTTDYDGSGSITTSDRRERLGYRLTGDTLQLQRGSTWRTVVQGVTSLSFTYFDFQGNQVNQTSPYTSYQDIAQVRISISAQTGDGSTGITESGIASIRNPNSM